MNPNNQILLKWLGVILVLVLAVVIILNPDGWGKFILDLAGSLGAQLFITLVLFGISLIALNLLTDVQVQNLSRWVLVGIFSLSAILALLPLPVIFDRSLDVYDGVQTVILIASFSLLTEPFRSFWRRTKSSSGQRPSVSTFPRPREKSARPLSHTDSALYQSLLKKVLHDRGTAERLIEYERRRAPHAPREELVKSAIVRWERDNR